MRKKKKVSWFCVLFRPSVRASKESNNGTELEPGCVCYAAMRLQATIYFTVEIPFMINYNHYSVFTTLSPFLYFTAHTEELRFELRVSERERERMEWVSVCVCVGGHENLSLATSSQFTHSAAFLFSKERENQGRAFGIWRVMWSHVLCQKLLLICPITGKPASTFLPSSDSDPPSLSSSLSPIINFFFFSFVILIVEWIYNHIHSSLKKKPHHSYKLSCFLIKFYHYFFIFTNILTF